MGKDCLMYPVSKLVKGSYMFNKMYFCTFIFYAEMSLESISLYLLMHIWLEHIPKLQVWHLFVLKRCWIQHNLLVFHQRQIYFEQLLLPEKESHFLWYARYKEERLFLIIYLYMNISIWQSDCQAALIEFV